MRLLITFLVLIVCCAKTLQAGNYSTLKIKEEFDLFNTLQVNVYDPCGIPANNDQDIFGDGMSKILDGYITMYQTTRDKAYLIKFVIQSLCIMENRHDYAGINSQLGWSEHMYQDGYIIGAMAQFVHLIRIQEPTLQNIPIYQFPEITPNASCQCCCNSFNQTFNTFGQYANWLGARVDETLDWYINNDYWDDDLGFLQYEKDKFAGPINFQIGFGRSLLFMGLSDPNTSYLQKANIIANLFKGIVVFVDPCEIKVYNDPVLIRSTGNNAYWWYHSGWKIPLRECLISLFIEVPKFSGYTQFIEDISHGGVVTWLPLDYYDFQPSTPFLLWYLEGFQSCCVQ